MAIKASVHIETATRSYKPGEVIREQLSAEDMAFLKRRGFVTDDTDLLMISAVDGPDDGESIDSISRIENLLEDPDGDEGYKDEAALQKMSKKEIVKYAGEIGVELDPKMLQTDLIAAVLNYTEQLIAEAEKAD